MRIRGGQQHGARSRRFALLGHAHRNDGLLAQPGGHTRDERLVDVLHDDQSGGERQRQTREQRRERRGTSRRRADGHHSLRRGAEFERTVRTVREQLTDGFDLCDQLGGDRHPRAVLRFTHRDDVERSVPQRSVNQMAIVGGIEGHDQDRTGRRGHDLPRRLDAIHDGQQNVHQNKVGHLAGASGDRFGAIGGGPDDVVLGAGIDRQTERTHPAGIAIDDPDPHVSGGPMRSTTACNNVSS